jgi:hypothetical protein
MRRKIRVRKLRKQLQTMVERVRAVVRQTKGRIFEPKSSFDEAIASLLVCPLSARDGGFNSKSDCVGVTAL